MDFYVGTYTSLGGPGIAVCRLQDDALSLLSTDDALADPTYVILSADGRTLYAVGSAPGGNGGLAASYAIRRGRLRLTSVQETGGEAACHLTLDAEERFLYTANYVSGSVASFPVADGLLRPRLQLITHQGSGPNPQRQASAHAHQALFRPGTRELFVCDLGMDAVIVYGQDAATGGLQALEPIAVAAGLGPRHLAFDGPDLFYLACELGGAVCVYRRGDDGWACVQTLSTLPPGWTGDNLVAAVRVAQGRVYLSNRGHDSIARYAIGPDGLLTLEAIEPIICRTPRDFQVLPGGLLVACQDGGDVQWLRDGRVLSQLAVPGAVCVCLPAGETAGR